MAKQEKKKHRWIFPFLLVVYAFLFLGATAYGLSWFWDYMDAYEQSRPHIALNAYEEKLSAEYVVNASQALISQIDHHVQSEENCRQVLLDALKGKITCAKKTRESTESKRVYAVMCGKTAIGTMEMERCGEPVMSFVPWVITKDSFDISYLLTEPVSVTVPSNFSVYVNGSLLNSSYIIQDNIPYAQLGEFYDTYSLPHKVTYQAGPFLGASELKITDSEGTEISTDALQDMSKYISNCSKDEVSALDTIADGFIRSYVAFTSRTGGDNGKNYRDLTNYMVQNGELSKRMYAALDGLYWISDRGAKLTELTIHHYVSVGDGRYLCDLTYVVDTQNFTGNIQTRSNMKVFFVETEQGLRAESMLSY